MSIRRSPLKLTSLLKLTNTSSAAICKTATTPKYLQSQSLISPKHRCSIWVVIWKMVVLRSVIKILVKRMWESPLVNCKQQTKKKMCSVTGIFQGFCKRFRRFQDDFIQNSLFRKPYFSKYLHWLLDTHWILFRVNFLRVGSNTVSRRNFFLWKTVFEPSLWRRPE